MTVSVLGVCHRDYHGWVPGWLESVAALSTPPDEVLLVARDVDAPAWVRLVEPPSEDFDGVAWYDAGFAATGCEYVAWIGVDDRYRPCALDGSDGWSTDVVSFGMEFVRHGATARWSGTGDGSGLRWANGVPCGSPVRHSCWQRTPFQRHLMPFADWAFYAGIAALGGSFAATGRIDFDYRWHEDTPTDVEPYRAAVQAWHDSLLTGSAEA